MTRNRGGVVVRMRVTRGWAAGVLALVRMTVPVGAQDVIDLPADDRRLSADFEEVFRVGAMDGAAWKTFGEIGGLAFDQAGNLYIFDRQSSRIVMVDAEGDFVREIGRAGDGPGEFRMAVQFTVMRDGQIVVADLGQRAYQIFGSDGEFERMVGMGGGGMIRLGDLAPDPRGGSVISGGGGTVISSSSGPGGTPEEPTTRPIDRILLSGDQASTETIAEGWLPPRADPTTLEGGGVRFSMRFAGPRTFEPALLVGVLPDGGVAFSDSSAYAVKIVAPDGGVSRVLRRAFTPRPVTEAIEEAEKARSLEELEVGEGPRLRIITQGGPGGRGGGEVSQDAIKEMMRGQLDQMQFFEEIPVLMALRTSWSGKIWAQRRGDGPTDPGAIDVMTAAGQYVGTFAVGVTEIPGAFGPNGLAAYVETDDFDVPTVVVRKLPPVLN
jgi:6-bladed beta-propeller protein